MTNQELLSLREENARLNKELNSVASFFNKLSEEILDRYLKKAIKDIREVSQSDTGKQMRFLGDDYDFLSFFEQLCLVYDRGDADYYFGVDDFITGTCNAVLKNLNSDEKYILNHEYSDDCDIDNEIELEGRVICFLTNYTNKNIRKAQNFN
ncbi:MAG: hypothetical protein E6767_04095 [Dysgonomonas sp.]|nr:hypothetical protein [Dysgonomonas sp.]